MKINKVQNAIRIVCCLFSSISPSSSLFPTSITSSLSPSIHPQSAGESVPLLEKRYRVPSTDELVALMHKGNRLKDRRAIFWSTFPYKGPVFQQGYFSALGWAETKWGDRCNNFALYSDPMTDEDFRQIYSTPKNDMPTDEQDELRTKHMSKAFARVVKGTIWLVTQDGLMPEPQSTWSTWEFPVITRRGQVDKVMRVELPSGRETVFWTKADGVRGSPPPPGKI